MTQSQLVQPGGIGKQPAECFVSCAQYSVILHLIADVESQVKKLSGGRLVSGAPESEAVVLVQRSMAVQSAAFAMHVRSVSENVAQLEAHALAGTLQRATLLQTSAHDVTAGEASPVVGVPLESLEEEHATTTSPTKDSEREKKNPR